MSKLREMIVCREERAMPILESRVAQTSRPYGDFSKQYTLKVELTSSAVISNSVSYMNMAEIQEDLVDHIISSIFGEFIPTINAIIAAGHNQDSERVVVLAKQLKEEMLS